MVQQRFAKPSSRVKPVYRFKSCTQRIGSWCNGSTTVSKTVDMGSIPIVPAIKTKGIINYDNGRISHNTSLWTNSTCIDWLSYIIV